MRTMGGSVGGIFFTVPAGGLESGRVGSGKVI